MEAYVASTFRWLVRLSKLKRRGRTYPGVAAATPFGAQLTADHRYGNWIVSMISLILIFNAVNFSTTKKLRQMDRVILVLDLAIDQAHG